MITDESLGLKRISEPALRRILAPDNALHYNSNKIKPITILRFEVGMSQL